MKTRTTFAIAAIALILGTSLQAAPDGRKKHRDKRDAATQQIAKSFDAIESAVADARKQATEAIRQRDAAVKALQDGKATSEKSRKDGEAKAAAEMKSRKQLEANLNGANQKLANATKQIADLGNRVKAAEASKQQTEKQLAETKQKLEQANKALAVQLKTISDARKSAADAKEKHAETLKNLKAREADLEKLRNEGKAKKDKPRPKKAS